MEETLTKSSRKGRLHVGTSGWSYEHWKGLFYPEDLSHDEWLGFYAERFSTVEINNTFYQLPDEDTIDDWRKTAPRDFVFAVKMSRYLTHMKRLKDPEEPLSRFFGRVSGLGTKLGPVLFQLPPRWKANPERLENLLGKLPSGKRAVFEFRDERWFVDEVREALDRHGAGFCIFDMPDVDCPAWVTGRFVYLRFHGTAQKYGGGYPRRVLRPWAEKARGWLDDGLDVYAYFNNDLGGHAVEDAGTLEGLLKDG